jgi:release factor glutamine methyltransferase
LIIANALHLCKQTIQASSDTPTLDAQVLLAHIIDKPRTWVLAHREAELSQKQEVQFNQALAKIQANIPLPYIIGRWEFFGLDFIINPSVLIPRPETELLVEIALKWLRSQPDQRKVADIGTGSGCIAVAIAKQIPKAHITASDISEKALSLARINAQKHNVDQKIQFLQADLLQGLNSTFNLICANLPYIPTATLHSLQVFSREPSLALDGGVDGLNLIRRLLSEAPQRLEPGGLLLLEIDASQGISALALAQEVFPQADVQLLPDLAGCDRLIRIAN